MTEASRVFVDSNVWFYALSDDNEEKRSAAESLIESKGERICLTVQVINEVCVNLKRKARLDEKDISYLISSFYLNYSIVPLSEKVLLSASDLRTRHSFSFWDSLIAASALEAGASILFSEDMQDGFVLDSKLTIVDPFIK